MYFKDLLRTEQNRYIRLKFDNCQIQSRKSSQRFEDINAKKKQIDFKDQNNRITTVKTELLSH